MAEATGPWSDYWCRMHLTVEDPYPGYAWKTCHECGHIFASPALLEQVWENDPALPGHRTEAEITFCPFCLTTW